MTLATRSPAELIAPGRPLTLAGVADGAQGLVVADLARAVAARADAPATSLLVICRDLRLMLFRLRNQPGSEFIVGFGQ